MEVTTLEDPGEIDYQPRRWTSEQAVWSTVPSDGRGR